MDGDDRQDIFLDINPYTNNEIRTYDQSELEATLWAESLLASISS